MNAMEQDDTFVPSIHLSPLENPIERIMLSDLGFQPTAYSPVAATKPVPLFTLEAVRRIRKEVLDRDTMANHMYSDSNSPCVVRGHCPERAKFTYNAFTHPDVVARINDMAGIELTPVYDYEIGHVYVLSGCFLPHF
jgi:hypothetical protein